MVRRTVWIWLVASLFAVVVAIAVLRYSGLCSRRR
jgi:hypothetical protein